MKYDTNNYSFCIVAFMLVPLCWRAGMPASQRAGARVRWGIGTLRWGTRAGKLVRQCTDASVRLQSSELQGKGAVSLSLLFLCVRMGAYLLHFFHFCSLLCRSVSFLECI